MSRRKVKMRELCLYKNEIICIELCLCKDRRNNKNLLKSNWRKPKIRICNQKYPQKVVKMKAF